MVTSRIILVGFGTVGQGFAEILTEKATELESKHGFTGKIVGVATGSKGILHHPDGLSIPELLEAIKTGSLDAYPESGGLERSFEDAEQLIRTAQADVLVEASPTNLETAQPAMRFFAAALECNMHIVTANKGPIALAYPQLRETARTRNLQVRFEATVMAGTPTIATGIELLSGCEIRSAKGILNGTTNYMLSQMEGGMTYAEALQQAQELGYAETDPTADVEGWDAAAKVLILSAALYGRKRSLSDLKVSGITQISPEDITAAQAAGERYKLIASATLDEGRVEAVRLPLADPLSQIQGATNAITFSTDLMGDVTIIGSGAGRKETGFGLLMDLLAIQRQT